MGTPQGIRTRKYHGFLLGIPGRAETCFLSELEIECNGQNLWPHRYAGPSGEPVEHPAPSAAVSFEQTEFGPLWSWKIKEGPLRFSVSGGEQGGIRLSWAWSSSSRKAAHLRVRPFWALRPLHGIGGTAWQWQALPQVQTGERRALIIGENGEENECALSGAWEWKEDPLWYRNFLYTEELERGYAPSEDLFAAGLLEVTLPAGDSASLTLAVNREDLDCPFSPAKRKSRAQDFVLTQPAGLVAGFPWFGEWGRDTFVSLPGIVAARLRAGENPEHVWVWAKELLLSWGQWIGSAGMLPNLIESGGSHQWESADATLWWCHAVASIWSFSLATPEPLGQVRAACHELLSQAIEAIRSGRHLFLQEAPNGLLAVTEGHATWMDAQTDGVAVTPRTGFLPEINALWFQARCLHELWSGNENSTDLELLGKQVLQIREIDRPNQIFLHSLPLAPSFVLRDRARLAADLSEISSKLWTPVGLRTLAPGHPGYQARCVGTQAERDLVYHQGPAWGWLRGHFEMARARAETQVLGGEEQGGGLPEMPIPGHLAELFDAEAPFTPRGAPAQAWSLACLEEHAARRRGRIDPKLSKVFAQRWLNRSERRKRREESSSAPDFLDGAELD